MRKGSVAGIVGAVTIAATVTYMLIDKSKRDHIMKKTKSPTSSTLPIEAAKDPSDQLESTIDQGDQLENEKMVSEGSQFGVNYYNKLKQ